MPKLILAAVAWFLKTTPMRAADTHAQMTCSRTATRRLQAYRSHEPCFDLSPLDLTSRHYRETGLS